MRIPLIEDLTTGPIPPGSNLVVEFTGASQWYNTSLTIAAGWLKQAGQLQYQALDQSPDAVRSQLNRLGLSVEELEKYEKLIIIDWYTATLGQKSKEKYAPDSLKVADLSIMWSRDVMRAPSVGPDWLGIVDSISTLARFNDEKSWVEFYLARGFPGRRLRKATNLRGLMRGVHGGSVYEQLEAAAEGVIDFKVEDSAEGETNDFVRIRKMRDVLFAKGWHRLKVSENFEVTLDKKTSR